MEKLRTEIEGVKKDDQGDISFEDLTEMPYLDAVINGIRME